MHLILKSNLAHGPYSFLGKMKALESLTRRVSGRSGVKLYDLAIAGNHLHLIIRPKSPRAYRAFVRALSGLIPRLMMNVQRGRALRVVMARISEDENVEGRHLRVEHASSRRNVGVADGVEQQRLWCIDSAKTSFWQARPFTRIVSWGRDYVALKTYLIKNRLDLVGMTRQASREMLESVKALLEKRDCGLRKQGAWPPGSRRTAEWAQGAWLFAFDFA